MYRTSFDYQPAGYLCTDPVFEGLDTFASLKLNGIAVLIADNIFLEYCVDVKDTLREGAERAGNLSSSRRF